MFPSELPILALTFPGKTSLPFLIPHPAAPAPKSISCSVLAVCSLLSHLRRPRHRPACLLSLAKTPLTQSSCTKQTFLKRWLMGADGAIRACCRKFFQMQHRASSVLEGHCPSPHKTFLCVRVPLGHCQGTESSSCPKKPRNIPSCHMEETAFY